MREGWGRSQGSKARKRVDEQNDADPRVLTPGRDGRRSSTFRSYGQQVSTWSALTCHRPVDTETLPREKEETPPP